MTTLLIFLGTILVLVGIHEAGHFFAAKLSGVYVKEFAIGFGPKLLSIQRGETRYSIRALPFGGYVSMAGEDRAEEDSEIPRERFLYSKPPSIRILVSLAGPIANLLMTIIVLILALWIFGIPLIQVADVIPGGAAEAVLLPGDRILSIANIPIYTDGDLTRAVQGSAGEPIEVTVERDGERQNFMIAPRFNETVERYLIGIFPHLITFTNTLSAPLDPASVFFAAGLKEGDTIVAVEGIAVQAGIGIGARVGESLPADMITVRFFREGEEKSLVLQTAGLNAGQVLAGVTFTDLGIGHRRLGFVHGIGTGARQFAGYVRLIGRLIRGLTTGRLAPGATVAGPVGIARILGDSARRGGGLFLQIFASLSLSLGFLNLIPFPALDGSRAAFALYEIVRRRPIPVEREGMIHAIGFFFLIALMLFITYRDILNLFQ